MSKEHVKIFSIEGNIGSGKSTLVSQLKSNMNSISSEDIENNSDKIFYLAEPVDIWESIKDEDGKNIIEKFYADQKKYAFSFQLMAYVSRLHELKKAIQSGNKIIICERSIYTDKNVFAKMLFDNKNIEKVNYEIYLKWFDEFTNDIPKIKYIYVKTSPEKCYERVIKRNRKGETIPLEYLKLCGDYHDNWILNTEFHETLVLDGNIEYTERAPDYWFSANQYGSSSGDNLASMAVDNDGNTYVVGQAQE